MKTIISIATFLVISITALAQTAPTVTIITEGTRNRQVVVDNKTYTATTSGSDQSIVITDLQPGQHTIGVLRANQNSRFQSTFNLRAGYDLTITVGSNGSLSTSETRSGRGGNSGTTLSANAFNRLYTQTKNKTSSTARTTFLETEFNRVNRKFTARQVSQLIQLVNSESQRLKLAKLAYPRVNDTQNFSLVSNLLNSTANRRDLDTYIASLPGSNEGEESMTDERFTTIYNEVIAERSSADRTYYLNNFFSREYNYYTSDQARRLIQTVTGELERLSLAKAAYRGVTDRANYSTVSSLLNNTSSRNDLASYINLYNTNNPETGTIGTAMSTTDFDRLYSNVYYASSTSRYSLINTAFLTSGNYFTTAQARKLIALVNNESNRLQLSKTVYRALVDKANYQQFNDVLTTTASRNDFYAYVNTYNGGGVAVRVPMTDDDFKSMYRNVQLTFGLGAKYNSLTQIFNTETNYFTVSQAKQLIQLVSSESNRLELAKLSYNNITDPANFSSVYDIFSSQSSKNELAAYVAGNASLQ